MRWSTTSVGDRIALLDSGHLRCCGSPGFLKSRFLAPDIASAYTKEVPSVSNTPTSACERQWKTVEFHHKPLADYQLRHTTRWSPIGDSRSSGSCCTAVRDRIADHRLMGRNGCLDPVVFFHLFKNACCHSRGVLVVSLLVVKAQTMSMAVQGIRLQIFSSSLLQWKSKLDTLYIVER